MEGIASVNCFGLKKKNCDETHTSILYLLSKDLFLASVPHWMVSFFAFFFFAFFFLITAAHNCAWVVFLNCSLTHHIKDQLFTGGTNGEASVGFTQHPGLTILIFPLSRLPNMWTVFWKCGMCVCCFSQKYPWFWSLSFTFPLLKRKDRLSHLTVSPSCGKMNFLVPSELGAAGTWNHWSSFIIPFLPCGLCPLSAASGSFSTLFPPAASPSLLFSLKM